MIKRVRGLQRPYQYSCKMTVSPESLLSKFTIHNDITMKLERVLFLKQKLIA
jgi:hypothetical protein